MIAFADDAALARLCIAATAVPHNRRGHFLRAVANKIDPSRRKSGAAKPTRGTARYSAKWRARARAGHCLLRLEVDEVELSLALVDAGLLDPLLADDRAALTAATQRALALFLAGQPSRREAEICDSVKMELAATMLQKALSPDGKSPTKRVRK